MAFFSLTTLLDRCALRLTSYSGEDEDWIRRSPKRGQPEKAIRAAAGRVIQMAFRMADCGRLEGLCIENLYIALMLYNISRYQCPRVQLATGLRRQVCGWNALNPLRR